MHKFFQLFLKKRPDTEQRWIFGVMLAFSLSGLIAAFVLTVEEFHLLRNPDAILSCSFNLVLNCAAVMQTWQASVFGFPNMVIGLMAYPVIVTIAVAGLAGVKFPRWFMVAANAVTLLGALFAYWLFFSSVYAIQVLCPWCIVVTISTTLILEAFTRYNLRENNFKLPKKHAAAAQAFLKKDYHTLVVAAWLVLLTALVVAKFGADLFA